MLMVFIDVILVYDDIYIRPGGMPWMDGWMDDLDDMIYESLIFFLGLWI